MVTMYYTFSACRVQATKGDATWWGKHALLKYPVLPHTALELAWRPAVVAVEACMKHVPVHFRVKSHSTFLYHSTQYMKEENCGR